MAVVPINPVKKRVKGRTQIETPATSVANLIDPQRIFRELSGIDRVDKAEAFHRGMLTGSQPSAVSPQQ
jgi:hypothetical protein